MQGIITAIYASFILAISETSLKRSYRDFEPSVSFFFTSLFGLVIWIPLGLIFGAHLSNLGAVLPYALISAIFAEALYFYALSKGQLSITAILLATYPIYTIAFSRLLNHEHLKPELWPFIALTIAGTLMSALPSKLSWGELRKSGAIFWPLLAAAAAGFTDATSKHIINRTSAYDFLIGLAIVQIPVALVYLMIQKQSVVPVIKAVHKNPIDYKHALVGGGLSVIGMALFWVSFNYSLASVVSPILATSSAIIVLFATLFLDESMTWKNAVGIATIFIGVLGISRVVG